MYVVIWIKILKKLFYQAFSETLKYLFSCKNEGLQPELKKRESGDPSGGFLLIIIA